MQREPQKFYVGNIHYETTEAELKALFEGALSRPLPFLRIVCDLETKASKGFGFFSVDLPVRVVVEALHNLAICGRNLIVREYENREADTTRRKAREQLAA